MTEETVEPFSMVAISVLGVMASRTGASLKAKMAETNFLLSCSMLPSLSPSAMRASISRLEKRRFLARRLPWVKRISRLAIEEVATVMGYSRMHLLAGQVAEFIRGLGYHAIPCGNDTALSVPIAIQAGLGHLGRHGRLITWNRGSLVRICKIFTDLPLSPSSQSPEGIVEFCKVCKKCAKQCPGQAIPFGPRTWEGLGKFNNPGAYKWYCDAEKCLDYWHQIGNGCNNCFRVCSFTKPEGFLHNTVKWFIRNIPILNRFWVWVDDIMGYGKMKDPRKYWE